MQMSQDKQGNVINWDSEKKYLNDKQIAANLKGDKF